MKFWAKKRNRDKIKQFSKSDLKLENTDLKRKLNLLKKYIAQSSILNKTLQVELFERSEELQIEKRKILEDEEEL